MARRRVGLGHLQELVATLAALQSLEGVGELGP